MCLRKKTEINKWQSFESFVMENKFCNNENIAFIFMEPLLCCVFCFYTFFSLVFFNVLTFKLMWVKISAYIRIIVKSL